MTKPQTITEADVRHVAKLSRLHVSDDEVHHFTEQLSAVLNYISKLNELDVEGVEPMAHPLDLINVIRPDQEQPGISTESALLNAPAKTPPYFKVPKVLGDGPSA
jgi:aspartyl-tRNA(Asn)/glutamyl-tRNA(Gln) amidotransferase subunit C